MGGVYANSEAFFDNLDRGVVLAAIVGLVFNGLEAFYVGIALTLVATIIYGLMRNRIANLDDFEFMGVIPPPPGINLGRFTLICKWLGSRQLFDGLLGDLVDPDIGATRDDTRRYIQKTLWPAIGVRIKEKILILLWLDRMR